MFLREKQEFPPCRSTGKTNTLAPSLQPFCSSQNSPRGHGCSGQTAWLVVGETPRGWES